MKLQALRIDHVLQNILGGLELVPSPIEGVVAFRLCLLVVEPLKVRVLQALLHSVSLFWVENEHFSEQVQSNWVSFRVQRRPGLLISLGQLSNVLASKIVTNKGHVLRCGGSQHGNGSLNLIQGIVSWEKRGSA